MSSAPPPPGARGRREPHDRIRVGPPNRPGRTAPERARRDAGVRRTCCSSRCSCRSACCSSARSTAAPRGPGARPGASPSCAGWPPPRWSRAGGHRGLAVDDHRRLRGHEPRRRGGGPERRPPVHQAARRGPGRPRLPPGVPRRPGRALAARHARRRRPAPARGRHVAGRAGVQAVRAAAPADRPRGPAHPAALAADRPGRRPGGARGDDARAATSVAPPLSR